MAKKIIDRDVLEAYRAWRGLSKTDFSRELGMSKQSYSTYVRLVKPSVPELEGLQNSAVLYVGTWMGDMIIDLLTVRGAVVPCVCETDVLDHGPCPKHSPRAMNVTKLLKGESPEEKKFRKLMLKAVAS